jgi:hypothetical protein
MVDAKSSAAAYCVYAYSTQFPLHMIYSKEYAICLANSVSVTGVSPLILSTISCTICESFAPFNKLASSEKVVYRISSRLMVEA